MGQATLKVIAQKAGVSHQTVSRVINNKDSLVTPATRERVLQIIKELDYYPNFTAQSLRTGKRNCIGMAGTSGLGEMDDFEMTKVYAGIGEVVDAHEHYLTFFPLRHDLKETIACIVKGGMADGLLIYIYSTQYEKFITDTLPVLSAGKIPFVVLHATTYPYQCNNVGFNGIQAGYLATWHLLDQGHRRIGCIDCKRKGYTLELWQGYCRAMDKAQQPILDLRYDKNDMNTANDGYKLGREILKRPEAATAYLVHSDLFANGFLAALAEAGRRVPDDVSLVSCGDHFQDQKVMVPTLTAVDTKLKQRGKKAAEMLFEALDNHGSDKPQCYIFQPELIVRHSSQQEVGQR